MQVEKWIIDDYPEMIGRVEETGVSELWYTQDDDKLLVPTARFFQRNPQETIRLEAEVIKFLNPIDWTEDVQYEVVEPEELFHMNPRQLVLDIETKHADWENNELLCIGLYNPTNNRAHIIPGRLIIENPCILQELFDYWETAGTEIIGHNLLFDLSVLKHLFNVNGYVSEDTMLLHYATVQEDRGTHGLKDLGQLYCGAPAWDDEIKELKKEWCKKHKKRLADFTYDLFPTDILYKYNAYDVKCTAILFERLMQMVDPADGSYGLYRSLIKASNVFYQIAAAGIYTDTEYLDKLRKHLQNIIDTNIEIIRTDFPDLNLNSPKQMRTALSQIYPDIEITTTDKKFIADLPETSFITALKKYRKAYKALTTYVEGIQNCLGPDNRTRSGFRLHGTATGRLSSGASDDAANHLNLQNISRDPMIKRIFIAPPGNVLVQYDMSGCELRVLAALSGDQSLGDIFREGRDLHSEVATSIFGPDFTKEQRVVAKTLNFGQCKL